MAELSVPIRTEYITLDAFLKWAGVADSGSHAKALIASEQVYVNGEVETRRGRKLRPGDHVAMADFGKWVLTHGEE